jgi:predicted transcriptional regulator
MPGKHWSEVDLHKLRNLVLAEHSRDEVAEALGRTKAAVHLQARSLGLKFSRKNTQRRPWTEHDDNALRYHSGLLSRKQLARKLGRTDAAVGRRAKLLDVRLRQGRVTLVDLAEELGVSKATVVRARDALGLSFRRYSRKSKGTTRPKGPEPDDIVTIARYLVNNPNSALRVSRKRLMDVIVAYSQFDALDNVPCP